MREVKFRGKSIDNGEWVYGDLRNDLYEPDAKTREKRVLIEVVDSKAGHVFPFTVTPQTVGQFTGLKDKNGIEVYEGDICESEEWVNYYLVIEWIYGGFQIVSYLKYGSDARGITHGINQGYLEDGDALMVVGNIHDNSELLKQ